MKLSTVKNLTEDQEPKKKKDKDTTKKVAENIKLFFQKSIGVVIVFLILIKLAYQLIGIYPNIEFPLWLPFRLEDFTAICDPLKDIFTLPPLVIVGNALLYSAAFELAYMLFTPGPDEAVEPLILGTAASILLKISETHSGKASESNLTEIVIYLVILAGLFVLKEIFIEQRWFHSTSEDE